MANSLREVKVRISSTESTAQITKAMYMVSQSKVKKAEKNYKSYQDFMKRISSTVSNIVKKASDEYPHPLLVQRDVKKTAYLIITSDRGLAGAYNSGLFICQSVLGMSFPILSAAQSLAGQSVLALM